MWEQVEELASESTTLTASFMIFMTLATLIACVGLLLDSPILIVAREVVAVMEFFLWEEREEDERLVALVSAVAAQLGTLFQQKQAEEALRASEEHFRAVADTAADAILSLDPHGRIAYANAAASRIFGRSGGARRAGR